MGKRMNNTNIVDRAKYNTSKTEFLTSWWGLLRSDKELDIKGQGASMFNQQLTPLISHHDFQPQSVPPQLFHLYYLHHHQYPSLGFD